MHSSLGSDKGLRASDENDSGSCPRLCPVTFSVFLLLFCFVFILCKEMKEGDCGVKEEGPIWARHPPRDAAAEIISVQ